MEGLSSALLEVRQVVTIPIHRFEYLEDCVEGQCGEVQQKKRPKHVDLQHFEITAERTQSKRQRCATPNRLLAQRTGKGLVLGAVAVDLSEGAGFNRNQIFRVLKGVELLVLIGGDAYFLGHPFGSKVVERNCE